MLRPSNSARRIDTEALKAERPLVDVAAAYGVTLRRESAGTYRALCPFHQEHTPSFWIDARGDASEQHYFCFGCTSHGDVVTFVMEREGCSFQEACERLSTHAQPPVVETSQKALSLSLSWRKPPGRRWEELSADSAEARVFDLALKVFENTLWQDARAQAYLRRRAISAEVARAQRLGYANGRALLDWLRGRKDSGEDLVPVAVQLGLLLERPGAEDDRPAHREFFVDRLIIPELRQGRPIWCIGRAVEDEVQPAVAIEVSPPAPIRQDGPRVAGADGTRTPIERVRRPRPKYLGLPGEKPVMGLEQVKGRRAAFIVEGPFDLLAATGWGLPAFAICGTHFPTERLPALEQALAIYGVFDPDRAGRSAAERFAPLFGSRWRPVRLPNNLDLAELATLGTAGREIFDILVGRARAAAWQRAQAL
ncbi:MAG: CHC2 zinc finger domain-containing protein [Chloroflexota bacterium]|nr:CHC2 zinc finger domain-containing protein [Chloroflexota bacterium]